MDMATQLQIPAQAVCISYCANAHKKDMYQTILPPAMGKF